MTTNKPEVFEVYRTKQDTLENVVLLSDYESLQAECKQLGDELVETELRALKFIHQCNAHVELYRELRDERDALIKHLLNAIEWNWITAFEKAEEDGEGILDIFEMQDTLEFARRYKQ